MEFIFATRLFDGKWCPLSTAATNPLKSPLQIYRQVLCGRGKKLRHPPPVSPSHDVHDKWTNTTYPATLVGSHVDNLDPNLVKGGLTKKASF